MICASVPFCMTDNILASMLAGAAVVGAVTVASLLHRADRKRALASLAAQNCPQCKRDYGPEIARSVNTVKYRWVLAPGHSTASLDLPDITYLVACPHCSAEHEFRENGQLFVHPQLGVLDFTRTGKTRSQPRAASQ